jgi:hypothetical protein
MLEMRSTCERCTQPLAHGSDAFICSYECTFCDACADQLEHICPNCGGELVRRPIRPAERLARAPASTRRVYNPRGCGRTA